MLAQSGEDALGVTLSDVPIGISGEADASLTADPQTRLCHPPAKRRRRLLLGAAAVVIVAAASVLGLAVIRPHPAGQATGTGQGGMGDPLAPAAQLATLPVPEPATPAATPAVPVAAKADALKEGLAYGVAPAADPAPTDTATDHPDAANAVEPVGRDERTAEIAAATGPAVAEVGLVAEPAKPAAPLSLSPVAAPQAAVPAKTDTVATAVALQAAPMAEPQQVEVLSLVTELGVLLRDMRSDIAGLRADQQRAAGTVGARLADFDRRLGLAEAKGAIAAAMGGARTALAEATSPAPPIADPRPASETRPAKASAAPGEKPHYRVQAASPGLAMLAELGGDAAKPLEIAVGDEVPGYGRVTAIGQRGAAWVVQTEHGTIQ